MSEKPLFGLRLATGNSRKLEQAQKTLPKDITLSVIKPLFNEDEIKDRLDVPLTRGIEYVGALSREKFLVQRKKEKESAKKEEDDFTLICSDSVVLFEKDGRQIALNRNATDKQKAEAITAINRDKEITFVGATTFGWRDGISALTIATYLKVPLKSEIKALPFEIDNLPNMVTKEGFEIGFIDFEMDRKKGEFKLKFKRKDETKDFDRARPFISGNASEVWAFIKSTSLFEKKHSCVLQEVIEESPFNTLVFYANYSSSGQSLKDFYTALVNDRHDFFSQYGGNCSFFSLELADRLHSLNPQVVIYPSLRPEDKNGHSSLLVNKEGYRFVFDPGLSIPFPIPLSEDISLFPFYSSGKWILAGVGDLDKKDRIPDLIILRKKGKKVPLIGRRVSSVDEFREKMPEILQGLHEKRDHIKMDFHNGSGMKVLGIAYSRKSKKLEIKSEKEIIFNGSLGDFLSDSSFTIKGICDQKNLPYDVIIEQLQSLLLYLE